MNQFLRSGDPFPPLIHKWVFFGDGGIGHMWAIDPAVPNRVIEWDAEWGEDFEVVGKDPFEAWERQQQRFDDASSRLDAQG